ncbi:unnamed protein product [Timema podura]|uniref:Fatty acyl-CoA reductase n=1 Tax=Timema podura TaxID=61482 RepID=A0ABN7NR83_TIMPD|nr:unnamed protein product [Timema podura]
MTSHISPSFKEPVCGWIDNVYGPNGATLGAFAGLVRTGISHAETKLDIIPVDMQLLLEQPQVSPSFKEPVCGWIDNVYGPNGATVGAIAGLVRTGISHAETKLDIIPVDMVANCIIAAAFGATTSQDTRPDTVESTRPIRRSPDMKNLFSLANILGDSGYSSDKDPTWQPEKDEQRGKKMRLGKIYRVLPTEDTIEKTNLASNTDIDSSCKYIRCSCHWLHFPPPAGAVDEFLELPNYGPQADLTVESGAHATGQEFQANESSDVETAEPTTEPMPKKRKGVRKREEEKKKKV